MIFILISCSKQDNEVNRKSSNNILQSISISKLDKLKSIQKSLDEPKPGEWRYVKREVHQSFLEYKKSNPVRPNKKQNKIYIKPIGTFDSLDTHILHVLEEYAASFFGLETILLKAESDSIIPVEAKRIFQGHNQIHTKYVLNRLLIQEKPKDAIAFISLTSNDLYPKDEWNYVFGQANLAKNVGVFSLYRFKTTANDSLSNAWYLNRMMKTFTHELSHVFSIKHCKRYKCLMNGSNSLTEADLKPSWLCCECLSKLIWCTEKDILQRYEKMITFSEKYRFHTKTAYFKKSLNLYPPAIQRCVSRLID